MSTLPNIAFAGKMGSGKTTAAEYLETAYNYVRFSFADPLRQAVAIIWGPDLPREQRREKLQYLGRAVRDLDLSALVDNLTRELDELEYPIVVDDVRTPIEFIALAERGFHIRQIEAPEDVRVLRLMQNHKLLDRDQLFDETEVALDHFGIQTIDNSWGLPPLHAEIDELVSRAAAAVA